jgi:hypothetical protein
MCGVESMRLWGSAILMGLLYGEPADTGLLRDVTLL